MLFADPAAARCADASVHSASLGRFLGSLYGRGFRENDRETAVMRFVLRKVPWKRPWRWQSAACCADGSVSSAAAGRLAVGYAADSARWAAKWSAGGERGPQQEAMSCAQVSWEESESALAAIIDPMTVWNRNGTFTSPRNAPEETPRPMKSAKRCWAGVTTRSARFVR